MAYLEYQPASSLFHYCAPGSFDGITTNGSIWLSDLQYANDPKELQLAEIFDRVMSELIADKETSTVLRSTYVQLKINLNELRPRFGMYSFSLSLKSDQLPMWQEYTDRGRGYCIGFRPSAFNHMSLRVQRVMYVKPEYLGTLHSAIAWIAAPLVGKEKNFIERIEPITSLLSIMTSVKDDIWKHEDEVRLIFSSMVKPSVHGRINVPVGMLRDGTEIYAEDPLQRRRDGIDVPYFAKEFGRYREKQWDPSGAISQVIIGHNNDRSIADVSDELRAKGYRGFGVTKSRCSFRA